MSKMSDPAAGLRRSLSEAQLGILALQEELADRTEQLRLASQARAGVLANLSHDVRTPLTSILGLCRLLLERTDGPLTQEQEKQVLLVRRSVEDLLRLLGEVLDQSRVAPGRLAVRPRDFSVAELFAALRGALQPLLMRGDLGAAVPLLIVEPPPELRLHSDDGKIFQVLRCLIGNALRFTESGEVRVEVHAGPGDTAVFSVCDTGRGLDEGERARVFDDRAPPGGAARPGLGLGLPAARSLAVLLGGTLAVESAPGQGATFSLAIPRTYVGPAEVPYTGEVTVPRRDPRRRPVLVVEDSPENLYLYEKYLHGTSFQIVPARDLDEAREALRQFRPAAVMLDVRLKRGELGWTFLSELKAQESTRSIPTFVITVVDEPGTAAALGADEYWVKPVDRQQLLSRLEALTRAPEQRKVLVVDDDPIARYLLTGLLVEEGYTVIEAPTAAEGLRLAAQEQPHAVFLDLVLPDMGGQEALAILKQEPTTARIPVIAHSAKLLGDDEYRRLAESAAAVLSKESMSREAVRAVVARATGPEGTREDPQ